MALKICVYEDDTFLDFYPISLMRPVLCMRSGILPQFARANAHFDGASICLAVRHSLSESVAHEHRDCPVNIVKRESDQAVLFINGRIRNYGDLPSLVARARISTRFVQAGTTVAVLFESNAWPEIPSLATPDMYEKLVREQPDEFPTHETTATLYRGCWEMVADIESVVTADFKFLKKSFPEPDRVKVHQGAHLINADQVYLGTGVEMLPVSLIDASHGPVYVGDNTRIESQVTINGPCYIGPNCVVVAGKVGGSSIGHTCRVGGEVEESIFQSYVNKYHAGFVGHAYVGSWVNFGAMTTNSDLKNNYSEIVMRLRGHVVSTGSIKVGSFIGDHTKFGIGTLLNTGINIGVCCNIFGGTLITDKEVPCFRWGNSQMYKDYHFDKALDTIQRAAERRGVTLSKQEIDLLQAISEHRFPDEGVLRFSAGEAPGEGQGRS